MSRFTGRDMRQTIVKSLATNLVMIESVTTTRSKAKSLVPYFEKLVTKAKKQDLHSYRQIRSKVTSDEAALKLQKELGSRFDKRPGGYTRIKPAGYRMGDNTELVAVSLTEKAPIKAGKVKIESPKALKPATKTAVAKPKTTKAKSTA